MGNYPSELVAAYDGKFNSSKPLSVFGSEYIETTATEIVMKENLLVLGSYTIKDSIDNPVFNIDGSVFALRQYEKLLDLQNNEIGSIKGKYCSMHKRRYLLDSENNVRIVLRRRNYLQLVAVVDAWILSNPLPIGRISRNDTNKDPDISIVGNWMQKEFKFIRHVGPEKQIFASTRRSGTENGIPISSKGTYFIDILPYVDRALVVLLAVVMDQMFKEKAVSHDF